jgi:hypothetical protein
MGYISSNCSPEFSTGEARLLLLALLLEAKHRRTPA